MSGVTAYIKADVTCSYPYYSFTDEEKAMINDLPIYIWSDITSFDCGKSDEFGPYYDIVQQMIGINAINDIPQ